MSSDSSTYYMLNVQVTKKSMIHNKKKNEDTVRKSIFIFEISSEFFMRSWQ